LNELLFVITKQRRGEPLDSASPPELQAQTISSKQIAYSVLCTSTETDMEGSSNLSTVMRTPCKRNMTTIKQLNNDLIAMARQGLIKKAGYKYNRAGDPEQRLPSHDVYGTLYDMNG
jgi:hypothetical protein